MNTIIFICKAISITPFLLSIIFSSNNNSYSLYKQNYFQNLVQQDHTYTELNKAINLLESKNYYRSILQINSLIKSNSLLDMKSRFIAYLNLGICYGKLKQVNKSIFFFQLASNENQESVLPFIYSSFMYSENNNYEHALRAINLIEIGELSYSEKLLNELWGYKLILTILNKSPVQYNVIFEEYWTL